MLGYGVGLVLVVIAGVIIGGLMECWGFGVTTVDSEGILSVRLDFSGVATLYSHGAGIFLVAG